MKTFKLLFISFMMILVACTGKKGKMECNRCDQEINKKMDGIIAKMTLDEKLKMIGGFEDFYIMAIPRLGLPKIKMSDASVGVRNYGKSTAYPASILLAASFDTAMARMVGKAIGTEARGKGVHIMLAPGVNITRAPMNGRNFEYLGEDPYLSGQMASSYIQGMQSMKVVSTVKHFAANNQEWDRHNVSSDMDERTLQEIYLPAFKAAVQEGHVGAVMNSYNLINGIHASQNKYLLTDVLKHSWNFDGIVMSDWTSTYNGVAAASAGLDLEMPSGIHMNKDTLMPAIQSGTLKVSVIDDKIRRILHMYYKFGFMDSTWDISNKPIQKDQLEEVALDAARGGIVLLKNAGNILPLDKSKIRTLAVLGSMALHPSTGGGGSSLVDPYRTVSLIEGIKHIAGSNVHVKFLPAPNERVLDDFYNHSVFISTDKRSHTLKGEFFNNRNLEGNPGYSRDDKIVNFNWDQPVAAGFQTINFSARWTGKIKVDKTGDYKFVVSGDDGFRLFINNNKIIEEWRDQPETTIEKVLRLVAGTEYNVKLEYYQALGGGCIRFGYRPVEKDVINDDIAAAKSADAAIVCVGFDYTQEGEGSDRSFGLPASQVDFIKKISAVNKNTIILLTSGGNADIAAWINDVPALLHTWFAGQMGGEAIAEILFGQVNPSGKLPITFEKKWEDNPVYKSYYDPDKKMKVFYSEGIFVGYRGYDKNNVEPLFPFGFGLSFTTFDYRNLVLGKKELKGDGSVEVSFEVTNTGEREGKEIVQLYISDHHSSLPRPIKELKHFAKMDLTPGETKKVVFSITKNDLEYYNPGKGGWVAEPGEFEVLVGSSSRDIKLKATFGFRE